jgi:hypothetical protein
MPVSKLDSEMESLCHNSATDPLLSSVSVCPSAYHFLCVCLCVPMCDIRTFVEIRVAFGGHGSEHDFYVCFPDYLVSDLIFIWCFFCRVFVILLVGSIAKEKSKRVM